MKKNILLLINGFGVEQPGSYDIYSPELMPNLDRFTKEKLFTSISSKDLDYKSGYRNFSIGISEPLSYSLINNNIDSGEYLSNATLNYIVNEVAAKKTKLHVFCFWESDSTIPQLLTYLKKFTLIPDIKIFVHLVLCQKSLSDYKNMENLITKLNYEYGDIVKIGLVTGESHFNTYLKMRDIVKTLVTEVGEKWKDMSKKISVLTETRTAPLNARTFGMNEGFRLEENDTILFFNYSTIDVNKFRNEIGIQKYKKIDVNTIKFYSLFPSKCDPAIPYIYNFAVSSTCTAKSLASINAKCLVLDQKEKCSYINYYLTGLRNNVDEHVKYMATDDGIIDDKDKLLELVKNSQYEMIIINYEINSCKTVEEIENKLRYIDTVIGELGTYVLSNGAGLFISSLYGIETELYNARHELCKINFSVRTPLIVVDPDCTRSSHVLDDGTVYDLSNTVIGNISKTYKTKGLLRKKTGLLSILYKKPKGGN